MADIDFDLGALDQFDLDGLGKREAPVGNKPNGKPLMVAISELYEDPNQPRGEDNPGFSIQSIEEMGDSIVANGIKQPIIVASKDERGHKIRDGARRYRGARIRNVELVPIIIDDNFDRAAQLLVNLQRADNTADEIVQVIWELENEQKLSRTDIAKRIGKSKAFVTEHAKFGAINPFVRALYENGECRDVTLCNKLDDLYKEFPDAVRTFATSGQAINRTSVAEVAKRLRTPLIDGDSSSVESKGASDQQALPGVQGSQAPAAAAQDNQAPTPAAAAQDNQAPTPAAAAQNNQAPAPAAAAQDNQAPTPAAAAQDNQAPTPAAAARGNQTPAPAAAAQDNQAPTPAAAAQGNQTPAPAATWSHAATRVYGSVEDRAVLLVLSKAAEQGMCWVADEIDGSEMIVPCDDFKLLRVEA